MVPACRLVHTISIFATEVAYASAAAAGGKASMRWISCQAICFCRNRRVPPFFKVGVPQKDQLEFFSDHKVAVAFAADIEKLKSLVAQIVELDFLNCEKKNH